MNWVILTVFAITSRAVLSIATKILSKDIKVSPITHSVLLTTIAGIISIAISPLIGGISFAGISNFLLLTMIMIVTQAFGNILFFKGLTSLDAGTAQIAASTILIWGTALSVMFLGSTFKPLQLIGIVLMFIAILVIQYNKNKFTLNKGIMYIALSAVLIAIFQISSADLSKALSPGAYLVLAYLGPSLLLGIMYFKKINEDYKLLKTQIRIALGKSMFASGASMLYFLFSYFAYKSAPDRGIVVVLLTSQVILSVILGIVFLKERENLHKKLIAGLLAVISGLLIKS